VVTRGHSWSLVVTRGHSWSLVVTRGHSCVLLDKISVLGKKGRNDILSLIKHSIIAFQRNIFLNSTLCNLIVVVNLVYLLPPYLVDVAIDLKDSL
jgi:hypothetical protein